MAFLDNSGDIILDAVLTDTGRMRMAQGNGTFKVTKFAFGDDEINYRLVNIDHPSGSAYSLLECLQTPILEAFTNTEGSLKSKLLTYSNPNLLYLPEFILNTNENKTYGKQVGYFPYDPSKNAFIVPSEIKPFGNTQGVLNGKNPGAKDSHIRLEFGLNVEGKTPIALRNIEPELNETQVIIECDSRFLRITDLSGQPLNPSFTDESMISTYVASSTNAGMNGGIVSEMTQLGPHTDLDQPEMKYARGIMVRFKVLMSSLLQSSNTTSNKSLWVKHGTAYGTGTWDTAASSIGTAETCGTSGQANNLATRADAGDLYHIDTTIRVTGMQSGASVDIPITLVKSVNFVTSC